MPSTREVEVSEDVPFATDRSVSELTLVEVAEQLEKVTGWIEGQRVREREARTVYAVVQQQTDANIKKIRDYAQDLVKHQQRKMNSFNGLLGVQPEVKPLNGHSNARGGGWHRSGGTSSSTATPKNIGQAILAVWGPDHHDDPLTTEEIAAALPQVGYKTDAAPSSIKSSVNQALAKLCRVGTVVRLRADGSPIPAKDKTSRARKYLAAVRLPEGQVL